MNVIDRLDAVNPYKLWILAFTAVSVAVVIPVAAVRFLPLNDYPFHLARIVILAELGDSGFDQFYQPGNWLLPNVAVDAFSLGLAGITGPETAIRIFIGLTLALQVAGVVALHHAAHGRLAIWPMASAAFVFHRMFAYGFINYLFGVGLALIAAAGWLRFRERAFVLPLAFVVSVVLIFCHAAAFGVFAVIVGATELEATWRRIRGRGVDGSNLGAVAGDLILRAIPFVAVLTLFILVSPTSADIKNSFQNYPGYLPVKLFWGPLFSLVSSAVWLDVICALVMAMFIAWAAFTRCLHVSPALVWAIGILAIAVVVTPAMALDSNFADSRLVPVALLIGIAALDIRASPKSTAQPTPPLKLAVTAAVLGLVFVRCVTQTWIWTGWAPKIEAIVEGFSAVEPGSTVFSVIAGPYTRLTPNAEQAAAGRPPLKHAASYAALHGPIFVPMTFVTL